MDLISVEIFSWKALATFYKDVLLKSVFKTTKLPLQTAFFE
jgi:hypothetical protein